MTKNSEMVSVPRELAQELGDLLYILTGNNSSQKLVRKYGAAFWLKLDELRHPLCKALAAPAEDVRAVVDEPVAWQLEVEGYQTVTIDNYQRALSEQEHFQGRGRTVSVFPLYRRPQHPVVMPDRYDESQYRGTSLLAVRRWNACLDEYERLNK